MRLSTKNDDPGYRDYSTLSRARVFFNGAMAQGVFTADEEQGLIVQAVFDAQGRYQLAPCKTEILTEVRHGHVRIEWAEADGAPNHPLHPGANLPA